MANIKTGWCPGNGHGTMVRNRKGPSVLLADSGLIPQDHRSGDVGIWGQRYLSSWKLGTMRTRGFCSEDRSLGIWLCASIDKKVISNGNHLPQPLCRASVGTSALSKSFPVERICSSRAMESNGERG